MASVDQNPVSAAVSRPRFGSAPVGWGRSIGLSTACSTGRLRSSCSRNDWPPTRKSVSAFGARPSPRRGFPTSRTRSRSSTSGVAGPAVHRDGVPRRGHARAALQERAPAEAESAALDRAGGLALDAAHARGVVHRDVKPANLLLDDQGRVKVADFGIATAAGLDSRTQTGIILGSAGYLSPEQAWAGRSPGHLSVRARRCRVRGVDGRGPFDRDSPTAEAAAHVYEMRLPRGRRTRRLPSAVDAVFDRVLAKRPEDRFASCGAFAAALRGACNSDTAAVTRPIAPVTARLAPPTLVSGAGAARRCSLATGATLALLAGAIAAAVIGTDGPSATPARDTGDQANDSAQRPRRNHVVKPPSAPTAQTDASDLNTQGYRLLLAGQYSAALPLLQRAVAGLTDPANPVTAYANFNLGQTLVRLEPLRRGRALPPASPAARAASQQVVAAIGYARHCAGSPPAGTSSRPVIEATRTAARITGTTTDALAEAGPD